MAALTLKGIPEELLEALRAEAERERRSLNQQAILLLERSLSRSRTSFLDRLDELHRAHGLPQEDDAWADVRDVGDPRDVDL